MFKLNKFLKNDKDSNGYWNTALMLWSNVILAVIVPSILSNITNIDIEIIYGIVIAVYATYIIFNEK